MVAKAGGAATWATRGQLGARVHDKLVELRYIDLVVEKYGENTPLGSDPTATMWLQIGWTYPYRHAIVRPVVATGDQSRDNVGAELQGLLDTAVTWGAGVMEEFWTGIAQLEDPPVEALGHAAASLADVAHRLLLHADINQEHLLTDVGRWEGTAGESFEAFVGDVQSALTTQVWLAEQLAIQLASTVAVANLARESIVNLLEAVHAALDEQLAKRANQGAEYQRELIDGLLIIGGAFGGLAGAAGGTVIALVTGLLTAALESSPASETVGLTVQRATDVATALHEVRTQVLTNADEHLEAIRVDGVARIGSNLGSGDRAILVAPRPVVADGAPPQEEFFHDTGTLQGY